ncbi:hypothetical protein B5M09_003900 [Aphanomyces astaci]|nr:hypothetical protein B5M09_003900 [Aphanomyces astaci]
MLVPQPADAAPCHDTTQHDKLDQNDQGNDGTTAILYDYPPTVLASLWTKDGSHEQSKQSRWHDHQLPPSAANVVVHGWVESNGEESGVSDSGNFPPQTRTTTTTVDIECNETNAVDIALSQFVHTNVDEKDAEIDRLTKQNECLVHLLRKVTAKVMQNRTDLAFYRNKLRVLMRPVPKPATSEMSVQTHDDDLADEVDGGRPQSADVGSPQIEALTWQLKVASAKILSLSTCLDAAKAQLDADSTSTAALTKKYQAEAVAWKAQLMEAQKEASAHRSTVQSQDALASVLCDYVGRCGIAIDPSMPATKAKALLQPHRVVRRTHKVVADGLYDQLTDSMTRELAFLSKLDAFDPTDSTACHSLLNRRQHHRGGSTHDDYVRVNC